MSIIKSLNFTDTLIAGDPTLTFSRGALNYSANWRVVSDGPSEVKLTNISSPLDAPETIRIAYSDVKNIYANTALEPSQMSPSKAGASILVELKEVITVRDDANSDLDLHLPVSYHIVMKLPKSSNITSDDVFTGLGRLVSALYDTGSNTATRLESMLRGSLVPTDI